MGTGDNLLSCTLCSARTMAACRAQTAFLCGVLADVLRVRLTRIVRAMETPDMGPSCALRRRTAACVPGSAQTFAEPWLHMAHILPYSRPALQPDAVQPRPSSTRPRRRAARALSPPFVALV